MSRERTTKQLCQANIIDDQQVELAVSTYLADMSTRRFDLADGYRVDLAAAVKANRFAARALVDQRCSQSARRMIVRTAILMARPVKA